MAAAVAAVIVAGVVVDAVVGAAPAVVGHVVVGGVVGAAPAVVGHVVVGAVVGAAPAAGVVVRGRGRPPGAVDRLAHDLRADRGLVVAVLHGARIPAAAGGERDG